MKTSRWHGGQRGRRVYERGKLFASDAGRISPPVDLPQKGKCNRRGAEAAETDAELNQSFMSSSAFLGVFLGAFGASALHLYFIIPPIFNPNPNLP
jgi:hypothetical protein